MWILCINFKKRGWMKPNDSVQRPRVNRHGLKSFVCFVGIILLFLAKSFLKRVISDLYDRQLTQVVDKYNIVVITKGQRKGSGLYSYTTSLVRLQKNQTKNYRFTLSNQHKIGVFIGCYFLP